MSSLTDKFSDKHLLDYVDRKLFSPSEDLQSLVLVASPPKLVLNGKVIGQPPNIRAAIFMAMMSNP